MIPCCRTMNTASNHSDRRARDRVPKHVEHGFVHATIDRSLHWAVQTPQVFSFPLIHQAYSTLHTQVEVTDDAALLEQQGLQVAVFPGSYANIKITTQEDVLIAEALIKGSGTL